MSLHTESITSLRHQLSSKAISPGDILDDLETQTKQHEPEIHAYRDLNFDFAREQVQSVDLDAPLGGIPIAIKDNINVTGQTTACASRMLENFLSPYDATVIKKLREAGAIFLGRANMDEFAMGSSCEFSAFGPTYNPWKKSDGTQLVPGGSSGGSAAAVAGDLAIAALGSDTGGSIRQPASFCGVTGLKPTYGRVSRYGLVAFASSLDQIGPLTKTVEDAALLLEVIAGEDPMENTSRPIEVPPYSKTLSGLSIQDLTIGVPKEYFIDGLDSDVEKSIQSAIQWYEKNGATLKEISLPHTESGTAVYYIIATAEASANLARFDGVRYGHRSSSAEKMIDVYSASREEGFGEEVKRRILLGTYTLSSGYYDAYYNRAQKVKYLIRQDFENAFKTCDLIITPTAPYTAFPVGDKIDDPLLMYLNDVYTIAANLSGVPAISIPAQPSSEGLPIGLQLMGPHFAEERLLQAAHAFQSAHDYHHLKPEGFNQ